MARKEIIWTASVGRDKGKKFQITEMSARAGHAWATRLLLALMGSGVEIDEDIAARGLAGLATVALTAVGKVNSSVALPLMDELLDCVMSVQERATRKWIDDDFEEVATIFQLQKAVFDLHVEPFTSGGLLTSASTKEAATAD
jgi:hypothetical protein